jgi:hypothetical protein
MVSPAGIEPTAPGLGILCSILLSYEDNHKGGYNHVGCVGQHFPYGETGAMLRIV